jgi:hypothetical protein
MMLELRFFEFVEVIHWFLQTLIAPDTRLIKL